MRRSIVFGFRIVSETETANAPKRPRHFAAAANTSRKARIDNKIPFGGGADAERLHGEEFEKIHNTGEKQSERGIHDFYSAKKRRDLFTSIRDNRHQVNDGTANMLTPSLGRNARRLVDGIDEGGFRAPLNGGLSKEERRRRMRESLEDRSFSNVSISGATEGVSDDFIAGGLPRDHIRDEVNGVTISGESSMFSTLLGQRELKSKKGTTSWSILDRGVAAVNGDVAVARKERDDEWRTRNTLHDRQWREDESTYHTDHDDPILEHAYDSVQNSVSIYTRKRLYMDGLFGVERFITREEERALCEELVRATQSPSAVFVPEESRYCVNLYEKELGVPSKDPLALSLNKATPLLMDILLRAFYVGLIPSVPNMAQVSEFVGAHSGYPAGVRSNSIGSFVGALSLVSPTVMHLTHVSAPWSPKLYLQPRSLYVVQQPSLGEYRIGFKAPDRTIHTFRGATRQTKDYRIEVLFACMDTRQSPLLRDAVDLTNYAGKHMLTDGSVSSNEASMPNLATLLAKASSGGELRNGTASAVPMDGLALKQKVQSQGLVGDRFKPSLDLSEEMARRIGRVKETVSKATKEDRGRSKFAQTGLPSTVPGRYPDKY